MLEKDQSSLPTSSEDDEREVIEDTVLPEPLDIALPEYATIPEAVLWVDSSPASKAVFDALVEADTHFEVRRAIGSKVVAKFQRTLVRGEEAIKAYAEFKREVKRRVDEDIRTGVIGAGLPRVPALAEAYRRFRLKALEDAKEEFREIQAGRNGRSYR